MTGLGWGILGAGGIARTFTSDLQVAGLRVAAVGSRATATAEAFAGEFGIPAAHGSYEDLVGDPAVDIVYIATPHPMHHANALLALDAGKHVLIEKPITLNAREAEDIRVRAEQRRLFAMEAMWSRFLPHMVRLRELIAAGELGDVRAFFADHTQQLSDDPSHRINAMELGGGALLDLGIYPISYSYELLGTPASVSATAAFKPTGADAQTATVFGYDGGQVATTLSSSVARGPNHATIVGTAGWVEIDTVWYNATSFRRYDDSRCVVESYESAVEGRGMQYQALEAERVIADGRTQSDILPMSDSVAIMGIVDRVRDEIGLRYPGEA